MSQLRVLLAQPFLPDLTLGSPKAVVRLGEALQQLDIDVHHISPTNMARPLRHPRLAILSFPVAVALAARRIKPDVVDVASGDAIIVNRMQTDGAGRYSRLRVLNRVLGMEHLAWQDANTAVKLGEEHISRRYRAWFAIRLRQVESSIRHSAGVVCLAREDKRFIQDSGWRRDPEHVFVIPPGVDSIYHEGPSPTPRGPQLFFLGSWTSRKGIADLVAAFHAVRLKAPITELVIAGAHLPSDKVLASFAPDDRPLVRVEPTVSEKRLRELMSTSSLCVMPSRYEGFGMAFLESMAAGLPVVGTPTGGMADFIQNQTNGVLVPKREPAALAAAILELLAQPSRLVSMSDAARLTAKPFSWSACAQATARAYEEVINRPLSSLTVG
jgi:glycosyltransferase involved in cell wall biosynthesis